MHPREYEKNSVWPLVFTKDLHHRLYYSYCETLQWLTSKEIITVTSYILTMFANKTRTDIEEQVLKNVDRRQRTKNTNHGEVITEDGTTIKGACFRVTASWAKWRQETGVLCGKSMPIELQSGMHKTVRWPEALCWNPMQNSKCQG